MAPYINKIVLVGFGTVAHGLCQILQEHRTRLLDEHGFAFEIVGIATATRGLMYAPEGLDLSELLRLATTGNPFTDHLFTGDTETLIYLSLSVS
jgi:homoserine dehydrogenase